MNGFPIISLLTLVPARWAAMLLVGVNFEPAAAREPGAGFQPAVALVLAVLMWVHFDRPSARHAIHGAP